MTDSFGALMPLLSYKSELEPLRDELTWLSDRYGVRAFAVGSGLRHLWRGSKPNEIVVYVPLHPSHEAKVKADYALERAFHGCPFVLDIVCRVRTPEQLLRTIKEPRDRIAATVEEDLITEAFLEANENEIHP